MTAAAQPAPDVLPVEIERRIYEGYRVLPVKPGQKFPPLIDDFPNAASFDLQIVDGWSRQWPACNWAVCCGAESGVWILDVDGDTGLTTVADWEKQGFALPATRTVLTSKGGRQLHFKYPENLKIRPSVRKLGGGLDVRGEASYGMLPPSLHPSGWRYQFADDDRNPVLPAPEWLLAKIRGASQPAPAERSTAAAAQSVVKGGRTNMLVSLAGSMTRRGMTPEAIEAALLAENAAKCDPPLPESKVRKIAADIPGRYPNGASAQTVPTLALTHLSTILDAPDCPIDYIWQGRLVAGTASILGSVKK
ncbi:MAG: bifunctional DNA primase/polymerase [Acidobacteriaceae bacterium]